MSVCDQSLRFQKDLDGEEEEIVDDEEAEEKDSVEKILARSKLLTQKYA